MTDLDELLKALKAVVPAKAITEEEFQRLQAGMDRLAEHLSALEQENHRLLAQRASLETQVMEFVREEEDMILWRETLRPFPDEDDTGPFFPTPYHDAAA